MLFSLLTAAILLVFAAAIFLTASKDREKEFYNSLRKEAITKADLYFEAQVNPQILQAIYKNNREMLHEVEVAIYDSAFKLLYHDAMDIDFVKETPQMIGEIFRKQSISFEQDQWQVVGLTFAYRGKAFAVTATAFDHYGYTKLEKMKTNIAIVFVCSILLIFLVGWYFSGRVLSPVSEIVSQVNNITHSSLFLRLQNTKGKDELAELSKTFNDMLDRLEKSFEGQKQFVSNISHEIRTPLSAIIAELEISLIKDRSVAEYKSTIENTLADARKMVKLTNSLLDLAKASYDPAEIAFKWLRVDELLLDAIQSVKKANPEYRMELQYDDDFDSDTELALWGNEYLLLVTFVNLIDNACKFSGSKSVTVSISRLLNTLQIKFIDRGMGIAPEDLESVFIPFYRGANKPFADGNGIGLSLCKKIVELHKGQIRIDSQPGVGTEITLRFPL